MSGGEGPMGAAKGKHPNTEALCHPLPPLRPPAPPPDPPPPPPPLQCVSKAPPPRRPASPPQDLEADAATRHMAQYLAEQSLLECRLLLAHPPSRIAAGCLCLAARCLGAAGPSGPALLPRHFRHPLPRVEACAAELLALSRRPAAHAVRKKYAWCSQYFTAPPAQGLCGGLLPWIT